MELVTLKITNDEPFIYYLLTDSKVKKVCREFVFYNIRFYREERTKILTLCLDYPKGNLYWYLDFEKALTEEIFCKTNTYEKEWQRLLKQLKSEIYFQYSLLKYKLDAIKANDVLNLMFKYNLREYQAYDVAQLIVKMQFTTPNAGLILSEQRTGKTRVAIATMLETTKPGSMTVIVCPKTAQLGWLQELKAMETYIGKETFNGKIYDTSKKALSPLDIDVNLYNFVIISYDILKRLSYYHIHKLLHLTDINQISVIGDEIHRLRNFKTQQSDAMFKLISTTSKSKILNLNVIGVTGTPAVKDSYDVFGSLSFINFSKIGFNPTAKDFNDFKEHFYNCEDTSFGKVCKTLKRRAELKHILQTCSVQTKQKELELFKSYTKKYKKIVLTMDKEQREAYNNIDEFMEFEGIDCKNPLVKLIRLQQICSDLSSLLPTYGLIAPKLNYIINFAKKNKNTKFIVMCKHTKIIHHLIKLLSDESIEHTYLTGELLLTSREKNIAKFKDLTQNVQILIIQQDAGREALTIPEAKVTIFIDRDFAQGYNEQAEARMTPVDGSVCTKYVIDLVMEQTVEELIYDRLVYKKESISDVNIIKTILEEN